MPRLPATGSGMLLANKGAQTNDPTDIMTLRRAAALNLRTRSQGLTHPHAFYASRSFRYGHQFIFL